MSSMPTFIQTPDPEGNPAGSVLQFPCALHMCSSGADASNGNEYCNNKRDDGVQRASGNSDPVTTVLPFGRGEEEIVKKTGEFHVGGVMGRNGRRSLVPWGVGIVLFLLLLR